MDASPKLHRHPQYDLVVVWGGGADGLSPDRLITSLEVVRVRHVAKVSGKSMLVRNL